MEYWNEIKQEWRPSTLSEEDAQRVNALAGWEMYRKAE